MAEKYVSLSKDKIKPGGEPKNNENVASSLQAAGNEVVYIDSPENELMVRVTSDIDITDRNDPNYDRANTTKVAPEQYANKQYRTEFAEFGDVVDLPPYKVAYPGKFAMDGSDAARGITVIEPVDPNAYDRIVYKVTDTVYNEEQNCIVGKYNPGFEADDCVFHHVENDGVVPIHAYQLSSIPVRYAPGEALAPSAGVIAFQLPVVPDKYDCDHAECDRRRYADITTEQHHSQAVQILRCAKHEDDCAGTLALCMNTNSHIIAVRRMVQSSFDVSQ